MKNIGMDIFSFSNLSEALFLLVKISQNENKNGK